MVTIPSCAETTGPFGRTTAPMFDDWNPIRSEIRRHHQVAWKVPAKTTPVARDR